jgi:predicted TIM-barrel fold metal-dependent hydrolase
MIIDIHTHVCDQLAAITKGEPIRSESWGKARIGNEYVQFFPPSFEKSSSPVEMLVSHMDAFGIDKALLMANPLYGYTNDYFLESMKKYPGRFRGVALVDLLKGKKAAEELAHIYDTTELIGFKVETDSTFQCNKNKHMTDADLLPVWDCINQYHQPAFLHLFSTEDIGELEKLIANFKDITYVICHMGADSCFLPGQPKENYDRIVDLAATNANVYLDTSTVPVYFDEEYPFPSSCSLIEKAYAKAGAEKLMWSSDYPGMLNHATYQELINIVQKHCRIPAKDLDLIMGKNAERLFFS